MRWMMRMNLNIGNSCEWTWWYGVIWVWEVINGRWEEMKEWSQWTISQRFSLSCLHRTNGYKKQHKFVPEWENSTALSELPNALWLFKVDMEFDLDASKCEWSDREDVSERTCDCENVTGFTWQSPHFAPTHRNVDVSFALLDDGKEMEQVWPLGVLNNDLIIISSLTLGCGQGYTM